MLIRQLLRFLHWLNLNSIRFKRRKLYNEEENASIAAAKIALKEVKAPKVQKSRRPKHISRRAQRLVNRQTEIILELDDPDIFMGFNRRLQEELEMELHSIRNSLERIGYSYLIDYSHYLDF